MPLLSAIALQAQTWLTLVKPSNKPELICNPIFYCNLEDNNDIFPFNYKKAKLNKLEQDLHTAKLTDFVRNTETVNEAWIKWLGSVIRAVNSNIPKTKLKDGLARCWIDGEVRHDQNTKHSAWRKAKRT